MYKRHLIDTSVGRIIFNRPIPQDLNFVDRTNNDKVFDLEISFVVTKKELGKIINRCIRVHGITKTAVVLDDIKAQGYKYSTLGAITISVDDMKIPPEKYTLIKKADEEVEKITKHFRHGLISEEERYTQVVSVWNNTTEKVTEIRLDFWTECVKIVKVGMGIKDHFRIQKAQPVL